MQWPSNSPDLSTIKNIWKYMKDMVEKKGAATKQQLKMEIQAADGRIKRNKSQFDEICAKRFELFLASGGETIYY